MNKEVKYGYVLFQKELKKFYSVTNTSILSNAIIFNTETQARNKRDELYKLYKTYFDIKKITVEYIIPD
ncbi:MAG: hypothetical protein IKO36_00975 [Bacteroidaceae bacterium]|nr:hypothetical protein [Bacteroidaceae bacterium]